VAIHPEIVPIACATSAFLARAVGQLPHSVGHPPRQQRRDVGLRECRGGLHRQRRGALPHPQPEEISTFFDGLTRVEPGFVSVPLWPPTEGASHPPRQRLWTNGSEAVAGPRHQQCVEERGAAGPRRKVGEVHLPHPRSSRRPLQAARLEIESAQNDLVVTEGPSFLTAMGATPHLTFGGDPYALTATSRLA
jgi:hypothetical protein